MGKVYLIAIVLAVFMTACSSSTVLQSLPPSTNEAATAVDSVDGGTEQMVDEPSGESQTVALDSPVVDVVDVVVPQAETEADPVAEPEPQVPTEDSLAGIADEPPAPVDLEAIAGEQPEPELAAEPDPEPTPDAPSRFADDFQVGACYDDDGWRRSVEVTCTQSHIAEAVYIGDLDFGPDAAYPSNEELKLLVHAGCLPDLQATMVAVADSEGELRSAPFWPSAKQWGKGDRSYVCFVAFDRTVTDSLATIRQRNPFFFAGGCYTLVALNTLPHTPVPCSAPHEAEVFLVDAFAEPFGTPYPGFDAVATRSRQRCNDAFIQTYGVPLQHTTIPWTSIVPGGTNWDMGARTFTCHSIYDTPESQSIAGLGPLTFGPRDSLYNAPLGTCVLSNGSIGAERTIVPCNEGHNYQLIGVMVFDAGSPYPGEDALEVQGRAYCGNIVDTDQRLSERRGTYALTWIRPSEQSWSQGKTTMPCFAEHSKLVTTTVFGFGA